MTIRWFAAAIAAAALTIASATADAQMVVNKSVGEAVDFPYYQGRPNYQGRHVYRHARHRHWAHRGLRIIVVSPTFPTPQLFGWFTCCL